MTKPTRPTRPTKPMPANKHRSRSLMTTSTLTPEAQSAADADAAADGIANPKDHFGERASDETIERTAEALRAKGYAVHVVENGEEAKKVVLDLLPEGAEVGQGASTTLEVIG